MSELRDKAPIRCGRQNFSYLRLVETGARRSGNLFCPGQTSILFRQVEVASP